MGEYIIEYTEVTTVNNQYPPLTSSRKGIFLQKEYFAGNQIASCDNTGYNIVPYGYFTYRHMSDDEIFHFNINNIVENGIVSTLYPVFTTNEKLDSKYLQYQLNYGHEFLRYAILQKQGGSRTYMYLNKLRQLNLTIPNSVEEQGRISGFLSQIDHLITLHQRKLDKLINVKKSMLEKMFPKQGSTVPEIRFNGFTQAWEQRKAKKLFISTADKGYPDLPVLSATQDRGMIRRDQNSINISHDKNNENGYKRVLPGQFVIHLRSFQGGFAHSRIEGITSPAYTIFGFSEPKKHDSEYWKYVFTSKEFIRRLETVTYGIRDGRSISYDEFLTLDFFFPSVEEQEKISQYLDELTHLITLHQCEPKIQDGGQ